MSGVRKTISRVCEISNWIMIHESFCSREKHKNHCLHFSIIIVVCSTMNNAVRRKATRWRHRKCSALSFHALAFFFRKGNACATWNFKVAFEVKATTRIQSSCFSTKFVQFSLSSFNHRESPSCEKHALAKQWYVLIAILIRTANETHNLHSYIFFRTSLGDLWHGKHRLSSPIKLDNV